MVAAPGPHPWTAPSALPCWTCRRRCDELWRAAVADLVENLDAEQPEDPAAAPRVGWRRCCVVEAHSAASASASASSDSRPLFTHPLPLPPLLPHQTLADWARLYIKYLQVLRKLGAVADLAVHPQKRRTVARMLRACVGRLLEIQPWLVRLCLLKVTGGGRCPPLGRCRLSALCAHVPATHLRPARQGRSSSLIPERAGCATLLPTLAPARTLRTGRCA